MARAVGVDVTLDDFQRISNATPFIADLKPSGKYVFEDLHYVGGISALMKMLHEEGCVQQPSFSHIHAHTARDTPPTRTSCRRHLRGVALFRC